MPEEETIAEARRGDRDAFESLYRQHAGRVYALCLRLTGDAVAAEERTQDVFVRAWEKLDQFRGESSLASWLHRLAVNTVLTERRSRRRREARIQPVEDLSVAENLQPPSSPTTAEGAGVDLERAIAALPERARVAFVLHDVEGYRHQEIALRTGISVGTSKTNLHRARKHLRALLLGARGEDET